MECVFWLQKPELAAEKVAAMGELGVASAGAMLKLVRDVSTLKSSPPKLLTALDVYVPAWETYPILARLFSWGPSHPVLAAAETALADLVDAARCCRRDLKAFIRTHYPWRTPPAGGEVHPCVGFWMGYFRCMLRNRISLYFALGNQNGGGGLSHLVSRLITCLEAVLEEKSSEALQFPGLHHVFMRNNTCAIMLHAMGSDLKPFLPPEWPRVREERMERYIKGYMDAAWAPVLSRLELDRPSIVSWRRDRPLDAFYSAVKNACSEQRCWKVPNPVLGGVLRKIVTENVVPVYHRFLEDNSEVDAVASRLTEELKQQLSNLFEG